MTNKQPGPDAIMQLGLAFWGSKALLSAVELDLFTTLARGPLTGEMLTAKLGLQPRGTTDWLDALVSLGMLKRAGDQYANTPATDLYLDRAKPTYLGGMLEMANARLYPFWVRSPKDCAPAARRTRRRPAETSSPPCTGTRPGSGSSCTP